MRRATIVNHAAHVASITSTYVGEYVGDVGEYLGDAGPPGEAGVNCGDVGE